MSTFEVQKINIDVLGSVAKTITWSLIFLSQLLVLLILHIMHFVSFFVLGYFICLHFKGFFSFPGLPQTLVPSLFWRETTTAGSFSSKSFSRSIDKSFPERPFWPKQHLCMLGNTCCHRHLSLLELWDFITRI